MIPRNNKYLVPGSIHHGPPDRQTEGILFVGVGQYYGMHVVNISY